MLACMNVRFSRFSLLFDRILDIRLVYYAKFEEIGIVSTPVIGRSKGTSVAYIVKNRENVPRTDVAGLFPK